MARKQNFYLIPDTGNELPMLCGGTLNKAAEVARSHAERLGCPVHVERVDYTRGGSVHVATVA